MPLRSSMRNLKSLAFFGSKSRKSGKGLDATVTQPTPMAESTPEQDPACNAGSTIYHLKNFDELVKRLHSLFLLYQKPLAEGRPIVFDEGRCSQALHLHLLLSIQAPHLLESQQMASSFELHDLGLRQPGNPLRMNPTCSLQDKLRQALREELGPVFANTSLEALGLVTALHVLERAISWLEPLLSSEGIKRVQIHVQAAQQPAPSHPYEIGNRNTFDSSGPKRRSVSYIPPKTNPDDHAINPRRHSMNLNWQFPQTPPEKTGSTGILDQAEDQVTTSTFTPGRRAYNFNKELPENALDRWVLEVRCHGHEPTLEECFRKLQNLVINYRTARQEPGISPPPVSTEHGRVEHALRIHQRHASKQMTHSVQMEFPIQQPKYWQQVDEWVAERSGRRPSTPYRHRRTVQHATRTSSTGPLNRRTKLTESPMPVLQESPTAYKTPTPLVILNGSPTHAKNGSPSKVKKARKMKIGSPIKITHHASGAGLASYDEIVQAMVAANEGFGHPRQVVSATADMISKPQAIDSPLRKDLSMASASDAAATRKYTFRSLSSNVSRNVAPHPQQPALEAVELHNRPADVRFKEYTTTAKPVLPEPAPSRVRMPFESPPSTPLDDQDAKVEALLTQLKLMQDVFAKARDSLVKSVGSRFIERVTDIAVGYGWFRASCGSYDQQGNSKNNGYPTTRAS